MDILGVISQEFAVQRWQTEALAKLLDEGNTLPFIARYRKEQHGSIDDQKLRDMSDRLTALRKLDERRNEIVESMTKLGVINDALRADIDRAVTLGELEDIYRPYRPKRRTRASIAREKGLEPLAEKLLLQLPGMDVQGAAGKYVNAELGVEDAEQALQGAMDIIAERVSDDPAVRSRLKNQYNTFAAVHTMQAADGESVYTMYYDRREPLRNMPGHRVLAMDRGEKEGFLKVSLDVNEATAVRLCEKDYVTTTGSPASAVVQEACQDAYKRLIAPSLDNELRHDLTDRAQKDAIHVFALNLKPLLMQPPIKGSTVIGLDPGIRMGCKVAVVDPTGKVLDTAVIYPLPEQGRVLQAKETVKKLIRKHGVSVAAIGNGTAGRETEQFFAEVMKELDLGDALGYVIVNEAGASVYSASKLAAEEFPQYDVNLRSAISIARRLQDPLAELVKIDPKAIGVGQYQHDLKEA